MHDTRTAFRADEIRGEHLERIGRINVDVVEKLLITSADQLRTLNRLHDAVLDIPEDRFAQGFSDN